METAELKAKIIDAEKKAERATDTGLKWILKSGWSWLIILSIAGVIYWLG